MNRAGGGCVSYPPELLAEGRAEVGDPVLEERKAAERRIHSAAKRRGGGAEGRARVRGCVPPRVF